MRLKNVVEKADAISEKINPRYDMRVRDMKEIHEAYGGSYEAICCSFRFGYLQGMKAAKAELKRGSKVNG